MKNEMNLKEPIFFERNRVFRVYLGGKTYGRLFDDCEGEDTMFPEEWIASAVKAINPKYFGERDGVSVVKDTKIFFDDLLKAHQKELTGGKPFDCLVKFLDSAIRLPVQVHPAPEFSRKHFNSDFGKTEAWLVIAVRENPKIYFGFNRPFSKAELSALEERSLLEKDIMGTALCCLTPKVGDVYLIKAGLIHAIGAGCTIIEVMEPTDFTIQPENWCGDYKISENEKYIGLDKDTALDCFDYDMWGEKALNAAKKTPLLLKSENNYKSESLISYDDTPCFSIVRLTVSKGGKFNLDNAPSVWIVAEGEGEILGNDYKKPVKRGDYFFLPHCAKHNFFATTQKSCVLIECLPSKK